MRLRRYMFAFPLSALAGLLIAGCPDDSTLLHTPVVEDAGTPDTGSTPDAGTPAALVRFADLAPIEGSIDVCIAADAGDAGTPDAGSDAGDAGETADAGGDAGDAGTDAGSGGGSGPTYIGPILSLFQITGGIKYKDVTRYIDVSAFLGGLPTGPILVKFIQAGAADGCAQANRPVVSANLPPLAVGQQVTIAAFAGGPAGLSVKVFPDHAATDTGKAAVRFLNGSPTGNIDFGFGSGAAFSTQAENLPLGGTLAATDGYLQVDPLANTTVSFRRTGTTTDAVAVDSVNAAAGSLTTAIAVGGIPANPAGNPPTPAYPYELLLCKDGSVVNTNFTDCSLPAPADAGADAAP